MTASGYHAANPRPTRDTGQAVSTGELVEAIALLERIKAAGRESDLEMMLQDELRLHYGRLQRPEMHYDSYSGADRHAREIAELMDVPYDRAIVAVREYVRGSRASVVLKALRKCSRLMDSATAPPSVKLAQLNARRHVGDR